MRTKRQTRVLEFPAPQAALLVPLPEAARMLGSTVWTVRGLLWDKKIPFVKLGRKHLIDPADLRAFVDRLKASA